MGSHNSAACFALSMVSMVIDDGHSREEQNRCLREIERHREADKSYRNEGAQLLDLTRNAQRLFAAQEPREKYGLLNLVLSNCAWEAGEAVATFRQPHDMLIKTTAIAARCTADESAKPPKNEIWLGQEDSNLRMEE